MGLTRFAVSALRAARQLSVEAVEKGQRQKTVALYVKYFYFLMNKPILISRSEEFL